MGFAKNRRTVGGPTDHALPVLVAKSPDGRVRAVLTTYANHAVTLSHNFVGGDWPGFAAGAIEEKHPGAVALVSIGCGADQNPVSNVTGDKVDVARSQGAELAAEVERVLGGPLKPVTGPLTARLERIDLPLAPRAAARALGIARREADRHRLSRAGAAGRPRSRREPPGEGGLPRRDLDLRRQPRDGLPRRRSRRRLFAAAETRARRVAAVGHRLRERHALLHPFRARLEGRRLRGRRGDDLLQQARPFAVGVEQRIVDAVLRLLPASYKPKPEDALARSLLDATRTNAEREKLLADASSVDAGALIAAMVRDLEPGTPEEYVRIPWIWRAAVAGGRRNQTAEMQSLLAASLPKAGEPLRDWQAVVLGGGVVHGISQTARGRPIG